MEVNHRNDVPVNSTQAITGPTSTTGSRGELARRDSFDDPANTTLSRNTPEEQQYLDYWRQRCRDHPLLRNKGNRSEERIVDDRIALKFDFEAFLAPYDAALRLLNRGQKKMPVAQPPKVLPTRTIYTKKGPIQIQNALGSMYDEKHQDPNETFYWSFSMTNPDVRGDYTFTYGNVEAAFKIMRPTWSKRLRCKKVKEQIAYDILPLCYDFLKTMQNELDGYNEDEHQEMLRIKKEKGDLTYEQARENWTAEQQGGEQIVMEVLEEPVPMEVDVSIIEFPLSKMEISNDETPIQKATMIEGAFYNDEPGVQSDDEERPVRPEGAPQRKRQKTSHKKVDRYNEEAAVMFIKGQLESADQLGITCKCYFCVKAFVRRSRCCPRNQYRNPQDCPHAIPDKRYDYPDQNIQIFTQADDGVLEAVSSVEKTANITFVHERPVVTDDSHTLGDTSTFDPHFDMAETPWNLSAIITRRIFLESWAWTESTTKKEYPVPKCIFDVESMVRDQISFLGFLRSGAKISAFLNGTRFHQGKLIMYYIPPLWKADEVYFPDSSITNLPHQFLDASVSNSAELIIPFTSILSHFPVEAGALENDSICTLGKVIIKPWNTLRYATGASSSLNVLVYGELVNPEVHQPCKKITKFSFSDGIVTQADEGTQKRGWLMDSFIGGLSAGAARLTGGLVTGGLRVLAGMVFDKPTVPIPPLPIVNHSVAAPCHGAGLDEAVRLSLSPVSMTETTPAILGATNPDFDILTLCKIPSLAKQVIWKTTDNIGTILYAAPVCPTFVDDVTLVKSAGARYAPSMLAYVSRAAVLWRGPQGRKIQMATTQLHSGRYAVVYDPTWSASKKPLEKAGTIYPYMNNQNLNWIIVDVQEQKEVEITLPFMSVRPWLRCDSFRDIDNTNEDKDINIKMGETSCGAWYLVVMNNLVAPSNVSPEVDINIYTYAMDGFELAIPNTLSPLFLTNPRDTVSGAESEYPFVSSKIYPHPLFPNRERIDIAYYGGIKLYRKKHIKKGSEVYWFSYVVTELGREEAFTWYNEVQHLSRYGKLTEQYQYMTTLPRYEDYIANQCEPIFVQSAEQQLSDRNNALPTFSPTKGDRETEVAPTTVSENMMNLSTLLKRKYPLMCAPEIFGNTGFTLVTVPVSPSFVPEIRKAVGTDYGVPQPMHQLAWFSKIYTYWRGSLSYTILYKVFGDIYVFHVPQDCRKFGISHGWREDEIQRMMSFAGTMAQNQTQGSLSVQVPFYSPYNQCLVDIKDQYTDLRAQNGTLYIAYRNGTNTATPASISIFIGAGEDFVLNLMRCAPYVYELQMTLNDCDKSSIKKVVTKPETRRDLGNDGDKFALPYSTGFKWFDKTGNAAICTPQSAPIKTQALEHWVLGKETRAKVNGLSESMDRVAVSIETLAATATNTLMNSAQIPDLATEALINLKQVTESLNSKLSPSSDGPEVGKYVDLSVNIVMVYMTLNDCYDFFASPSPSKLIHFAMSFSGFLGYNFSHTMKTLLHSVADWLVSRVLPRTQALDGAIVDAIESVEEGLIPAVGVIGTLIYAYLFDCLPSFDKMKKMIKEFFGSDDEVPHAQALTTNLKNAHFSLLGMKALNSVYEKMCELLKRFLDWMLERENPVVIAQRKAGEHQDRILRLIAELDELDYEPIFDQAMQDALVHNRFYKLMDEANELFDLSVREKLDPKVSILIKESRERCRQLIKRLESENSTSNFRYDPFVVCLTGETGTCKTEVMHEVSLALAEQWNLPKYNLIYNRTTTKDGFWNGYKKQSIVEWDEFGQNIKDDETEIGAFVNLRGNAPIQVSMAALDDKGRNFTSNAIIMTTNKAYVRYDKAVRTPEAFLRRRHIVVGCQHRRGTTVETLQTSETYDPEFSHIVYAILHNVTGAIVQENMTYREMLDYVKDKARSWDLKQLAIKKERENEQMNLVMPRNVIVETIDRVDANEQMDILNEELEDAFEEAPEVLEGDLLAQAKGCNCPKYKFTVLESADECETLEGELFVERVSAMTCCEITALKQATKVVSPRKESKLMKMAKSIFGKISAAISDFVKDHPRIATIFGILTLFTTGGVLLWRIIRDSKVAQAAHYSADTKILAKTRVVSEAAYHNDPGKLAKTKVVAEGSEDPQASAIVANIHPYVVPVRWVKGEKTSALRAFHIGGSVILIPYHFMNHAEDGDRFVLEHRVNPVEIEFREDALVRINRNDWCLFDCGSRLEPRKQMIKYFVPEKELGKVRTLPAMLLCHANGYMVQKMGMAEAIRCVEYKDEKYGDVYRQSAWRTYIDTRDGDCGSPLVGFTNQIAPPGKILGIHVAGHQSKNEGYSVLITRERLQQAWDLIIQRKPQVIGMPIVQELDQQKDLTACRIIPAGDYSLYGVLPNKLCPIQPAKTSFRKTPFYEDVKDILCPKKPAHLMPFMKAGIKVSPLAIALAKYGHQTSPFPYRNIQKVTSFVTDICLTLGQHQGKRIFSETEAIMGIPGITELTRINMSSSAGWPYQVLDRQASGKWHLFDDDCNIISAELRRRLDARHEAAKIGERVPSLWRDCLKDELRPNEKVDSGKTRLFTIAPVDFTILVRQYFMDFSVAFYRNYTKFFSAVGITAESLDWTDLYNYLREYGDNIVAGDFETFDGKLMPELIASVTDIVNAWYDDGPVAGNVRRVLINEMIHTMQLVENTVYATHQGNPSGNPLTVIINTIVNYMYMSLVWLEIYPGKTLDDFAQAVRVIAYGDDNLLSVKDGYPEFNQGTITRVLAQYNIGYTTETKTDSQDVTYRSLKDVTFLKRGFRKDDAYGKLFWLPTMATETLESFMFYYRSSPEESEQLRENMRNGLMFAAFHGKEYYNKYKKRWSTHMLQYRITPISITFEEQVDVFKYTCGLQRASSQEGGMETFMKTTNSKLIRIITGVVESPAYYFCASLGLLAHEDSNLVRHDDRYAVAIPSGEGKSFLCRQFPHVFVDHDDLLIKQLKVTRFAGSGNPWKPEIARQYDFPSDDRRILLVHHPDNTNRQILGKFITHFPNFIRINALQRLLLQKPTKLPREERNAILVEMAREVEPGLFNGPMD